MNMDTDKDNDMDIFFLQFIIFRFVYSFTKIVGQNTEISNNYILYSVPLGFD